MLNVYTFGVRLGDEMKTNRDKTYNKRELAFLC